MEVIFILAIDEAKLEPVYGWPNVEWVVFVNQQG